MAGLWDFLIARQKERTKRVKERQEERTNRAEDRQEGRTQRNADDQQGRTDRVKERQEERTKRALGRQQSGSNLGGTMAQLSEDHTDKVNNLVDSILGAYSENPQAANAAIGTMIGGPAVGAALAGLGGAAGSATVPDVATILQSLAPPASSPSPAPATSTSSGSASASPTWLPWAVGAGLGLGLALVLRSGSGRGD